MFMFNTAAILETRPHHEMYLGNESFVLVEKGMSDNRDRNESEDDEKSTGFRLLKQQPCMYITLFCVFLAVAARLQRESTEFHVVWRTWTQVDFLFFSWTLIKSFSIQLQKNCQHLTN